MAADVEASDLGCPHCGKDCDVCVSLAEHRDELIERIREHRRSKYGDPPKGPFFVNDSKLYEGIG